MRSTKAIFLALLLCLSLCGCSVKEDADRLKDNLLRGFNSWMQDLSKQALTEDENLRGTREPGSDCYTGSYLASYDSFHGEEFLFGGTALQRELGNRLTVTYSLEVAAGSASLYWLSGSEKHILAQSTGSGTYSLTLGPRDNYLVLAGSDFSGSLQLAVEDDEP